MNVRTSAWVPGVMLWALTAGAEAREGPLSRFHDLWTRQPNAGSAAVDESQRPEGPANLPSIRIEHRGERDWCLTSRARLEVAEGDILNLSAHLRLRGQGTATISLVTYDAAGKVVEWMYGSAEARKGGGWHRVRSRLIVPPGVASVVPRLTGSGKATVWMQQFTWQKAGSVKDMIDRDLPGRVTAANDAISVTFDTAAATLEVLDRRTKHTWRQERPGKLIVLKCEKVAGGLNARLLHAAGSLEIALKLRLEGDGPELTLALVAEGPLHRPIQFPGPFVTGAGTYLVVPMNEGISYPVDDRTIRTFRLVAYGGHGICMAFWGVTDGAAGHMAIIETPDDAAIRLRRSAGLLCVAPEWDPQTGRFGYERRLRYVFFDRGGHVALCKRYRAYAKKIGLFRTLAEKRKDVPAVDRLVGAVNVWCWDRDAVGIVREMRAAGIERILWSNRGRPETIRAMNDMPGVLTSRYDIYQDVMDPANFKYLRGVHPDWTTAAWPKDLMLDAAGEWRRGWRVRCKDGKMRPCGVLCDRQAIPYAERRVSAELKTHPYRCRFIDTTTASPWRECYHPDHPMTRSDSRQWKMKLLELMSGTFKLVTGSETGHDASVPHVHYFEGMLSLGPYRVPDAGRSMGTIWDEVPERVAKFQLGHRYRLPLWELVYHDCVVAQWYWGDYNNKLPSLWLKRDLFNALYGAGTMFMFRRDYWRKNKDRFVRSYRNTCPIARAVGYAEMTDHRFLTPDRDVQQTAFANGTTVTVNFGDRPYSEKGLKVAPMGLHVSGIGRASSAVSR
jgi:hypothetical protein